MLTGLPSAVHQSHRSVTTSHKLDLWVASQGAAFCCSSSPGVRNHRGGTKVKASHGQGAEHGPHALLVVVTHSGMLFILRKKKKKSKSSEEGEGLLKTIFFLGITDTVGKLPL